MLDFHKQFDDMIENTPLKKEDAVHELISLCTGWLKNNKVSKEAVTEIILDAYEEWLSEEEAEAHKTIVSRDNSDPILTDVIFIGNSTNSNGDV